MLARDRSEDLCFETTAASIRHWSVGVTTAPRRLATLGDCLRSLAHAGWIEPRIFAEPDGAIPREFSTLPTSRRDRTLGAFPNWYLGLCELLLREPRAEAYLMCQDDVVLAAGLREYLERRLWPAAKAGVVSVYCPSHYSPGEQAGFHVEDRGWDSWGALA
jgi:hypothetical protein